MEHNRICPCNACATAPNLDLKIVAHCGELQFITVQNNRKPFGPNVIEAHRLMKNSIGRDNYLLLSSELQNSIKLPTDYNSRLYEFQPGKDHYDGKDIEYSYSLINQSELKLVPAPTMAKVEIDAPPALTHQLFFPVAASELLEFITNYKFRHFWIQGVDKFKFDNQEVTKVGTEHQCIVNGKHINFTAVTKNVDPGKLVYGEMTQDAPFTDRIYQFYILAPIDKASCLLQTEFYWQVNSSLKKVLIGLFLKRIFRKNLHNSLDRLLEFVKTKATTS